MLALSLRKPTPLVAIILAIAVLVVGLVAVVTSGFATQAHEVNDKVDVPAFSMTREVKDDKGSLAVFQLDWSSQDHWRETLVSSNQPVPEFAAHDPEGFKNIGSYQEVKDGKYVRFDMVRETLTSDVGRRLEQDVGNDTVVPGGWFADLDWLLGRWKSAEVTESDLEITVRVKTEVDTEEWVLDKATGIPVAYRTYVDGKVITESVATSIVLSSGQVVR